MFPILAAEVAQASANTLVENPDWGIRPNGADVARYYPDRAMRRNLQGRATVVCQVVSDGALANCLVVDEMPAGENFGDAVLHLAALFRIKPLTKDGAPTVGRWIKLPIKFRLPRGPGEDTAGFVGAQACYGQVTKLAEENGPTTQTWQASLYWYAMLAQSVANFGGYPSQVENYAADARFAAQQGRLTVPKGWELAACLDKTAK